MDKAMGDLEREWLLLKANLEMEAEEWRYFGAGAGRLDCLGGKIRRDRDWTLGALCIRAEPLTAAQGSLACIWN